ncbi:MAG TPA: pilus assembly protein PilM [Planctomycetota bacterium]|nr:pilus assembly protein PilM [Planctomycetota bacterium]
MAISAIGVDLGNDTLKAARLSTRDGKFVLTGLGFLPLGELGHLPESPDRRLAINAKLQQMVRDAGLRAGLFSPAKVNYGLAGQKVSFRFLQTIPVPRPLLEKKVAFEVSENITAKSKVDLSYNYRILDTPQQDQTTALIGLALESEVEAVRIDCRQAQLGEASIDFSMLGLFNAYLYGHGPCFRGAPPPEAPPPPPPVEGELELPAPAPAPATSLEGEPETVAIVDIGAGEIKILICHGDDLYFVKANAGGGLRFSQSLAKLLNVNLFEAEAAKCEDADVNIDGHSGNTLRLTRPSAGRGSETVPTEPSTDPAAATSPADTTAAGEAAANWLDEAASGAAEFSGPLTGNTAPGRDTVIVENTADALTAPPAPAAPAPGEPSSKINYGRQNEPAVGSGTRAAVGGAPNPRGSGITSAPGSEAVPGPVALTTASGGTLIDPAALDSGESILNTEPPPEKMMAPEDPAALQQRQRRIGNLLVREAAAICANIESAVQFCRQQNRLRQLRLDRVLITGGGTRLKGLAGYMHRRMRLPVETLDPFRNIQIALPESQFEMLRAERDRLAVPIGLALGVLQPGAAHMPVITQAESARVQLVRRTLYLYYAAALLIAVVALGYFFATRHNEAYADHYQQVQNAYRNAVQSQKDLEKKIRDLELIRRETNAVELRVNSGSFIADLLTTLKSKEITEDNIWFTEIATVAPDFYHREEFTKAFLTEDAIASELRQIHANAHLLRDKRLYLRGFCKSTADPTKAREEASDSIQHMAHKLSKDYAVTQQEKDLAIFDQAWLIYQASANAKDLPKTSNKNLLVIEFVLECRLYEKKSVVMDRSFLPPPVGTSETPAGAVPGGAGPPPPPAGVAPTPKPKINIE